MKTQIKEIISTSKQKLIKVRLDYKTLIYLTNIESLKTWLVKYPDAIVIPS
jgi:hypothetical protein